MKRDILIVDLDNILKSTVHLSAIEYNLIFINNYEDAIKSCILRPPNFIVYLMEINCDKIIKLHELLKFSNSKFVLISRNVELKYEISGFKIFNLVCECLIKGLTKFLNYLNSNIRLSILKSKGISVENIIKIRAAGSYTIVFTSSSSRIIMTKNLAFFEKLLKDYYFYRIHKSYLINLLHLERIEKSKNPRVELKDGTIELVSRSKIIDLFDSIKTVNPLMKNYSHL